MIFKHFRRKMIIAITCVLLLAVVYPASVSANPANTPAFTFLGMDRNIVNAGQSVTFTIRTVGATFVFANVGGVIVQGMRVGTATQAGQTSWQLTVNPILTQTVMIYANTTNTTDGAAAINIPIIVNDAVQPVPGQVSRHRIYSVTEVASTAANTVTLNVVTDAAAHSMWIRLGPDRYIRGTLVSRTPTQNNWQVTYRPSQFVSHSIQVSANHAYVADSFVVSQNFLVNLTAPAPAPSPTPTPATTAFISRTSISSSALNYGERATITVRTNLDATHVWAEVDNRTVNARRGASTATARTWTIEISPNRTQTITIYANTSNSTRGADTDTIRVTVRDAAPEINSVIIRNSLILFGQMTTIDVRTNAEVNYVWAIVDGRRVSGRRESSTSSTRTWVIDVSPERSQSIRVYANRQNHREQGADVFTVNVTVN